MAKISVLHISHFDNVGGSGRSAYKIHCGLRKLGFESKMLVRTRATSDEDVGLIRSGWSRLADKAASLLTETLALQYIYLPSSDRLLDHPWYRAAHVVQLYNLHGNYFSPRVLPRISRQKRLVWRLSDMWPMTGHCAHSGPCDQWQTGCRRCPHLDAYPRLKWDTASVLWNWKRRLYRRCDIHFVAPSRWIERRARASLLLAPFPISIIRNGVDCGVFKPMARGPCRATLGIQPGGQGVLFLAQNLRDSHKGATLFLEAMQRLCQSSNGDFFVMLVGAGAAPFPAQLPCPVWRHGQIHDDHLLALVYNAADLIVHSAPVENLPNSLLEAMACGRPAVAFDVGGVAELVDHRQNGFLAPAADTDQLAAGVRWVLADGARWQCLSRRCRQRVLCDYSLSGQTESFAWLYRRLLAARETRAAA